MESARPSGAEHRFLSAGLERAQHAGIPSRRCETRRRRDEGRIPDPDSADEGPAHGVPDAAPNQPQLTSNAYDPVSAPGSATSSSSVVVVIPWTAPAAPLTGIPSTIPKMLPLASAR